MEQLQSLDVRSRLSTALVAGLGAGLAAAAVSVIADLALSLRFPVPADTTLSAFFAGLAGGWLYAVLVGNIRRPLFVLWILSLGIAAVDCLLIALLPLPSGFDLRRGLPIDELVIPIEQIGALLGLWAFWDHALSRRVPRRGRAVALHPGARGGRVRHAVDPCHAERSF